MPPAQPDIVERLLDAAGEVAKLSQSDLQVLLRQAAQDIRVLREAFGIRDKYCVEDEPPTREA